MPPMPEPYTGFIVLPVAPASFGRLKKAATALGVVFVIAMFFLASPAQAQSTPIRTPCKIEGDAQAVEVTTVLDLDVVDAKARPPDPNWNDVDSELRAFVTAVAGKLNCDPKIPGANDNYLFVWAGADKVPRQYLLHPTVARRPRTYMPADLPSAQWYEVVLARSDDESKLVTTAWTAVPAAVSGADAAVWLQSVLTAVIPGVGVLYPVLPGSRALTITGDEKPSLFFRVSRLTTDIVPAKLTVTTTLTTSQAAPANFSESAQAWHATNDKIYGPAASGDARKLLNVYLDSFKTIGCGTEPRGCEIEALRRTAEIVRAPYACRTDPECQAITTGARQWAAGLANAKTEVRSATFGAEPPKRWAFGPYVGAASYPDSVSKGEVVRVKAGNDSKLVLDPFTRPVSGFVAAASLRPHQPDYWSLGNAGPYAGVIITPAIGVTLGIQWRIFRQIGIAGGPMWLWHPTGRVGDVISSSQPLKKHRLHAWTFGMTFTTDGR